MSLQLEHLKVELQEHVSAGQTFWAKWDFKNFPTLNIGNNQPTL